MIPLITPDAERFNILRHQPDRFYLVGGHGVARVFHPFLHNLHHSSKNLWVWRFLDEGGENELDEVFSHFHIHDRQPRLHQIQTEHDQLARHYKQHRKMWAHDYMRAIFNRNLWYSWTLFSLLLRFTGLLSFSKPNKEEKNYTQAHIQSQMLHKSQRQALNTHQKLLKTAEDMNHKIRNSACWKWGKRDWVLAWRVVAERRRVMSLVWPLNVFSAWFAQGKMWLFWWVEPLEENMLEADFQFAADSCCEEVLGYAVRVTLQCEAFQTAQDRQGREHANVRLSVQSHLYVPFKNHNSI